MSGPSSGSKSGPKAPSAPRAALDALLAGAAADPVRRALWLDTLDQRLRPHLTPALAAHARLANVVGTRLVFLVDSPVWRAKLRLAATELLVAARSVGLDVDEVTVKVTLQPLWPEQPAPQAALPMSAAARDALRAARASLPGREPDEDGS